MPAVRVMEMLADEIVDVIAMGNLLVTAIGAMNMRGLMPTADVLGRAIRRVSGAYPEDMLVDVIAVGVMQMPVMEIVDVALVLDRRVPAIGSMRVRVACVNAVLRISHGHNHRSGHTRRQIGGDEKHSHIVCTELLDRCRPESRERSWFNARISPTDSHLPISPLPATSFVAGSRTAPEPKRTKPCHRPKRAHASTAGLPLRARSATPRTRLGGSC